jgi:aromatic-L-amino-acid/L-tryptophan decarboxylase
MGAGMFFAKDPKPLEDMFGVAASYMPPSVARVRDYYRDTLQWSRRFIGLRLYLALAADGVGSFVSVIEESFRLGDLLRERLVGDDWRITNRTRLPLVCFADPRRGADRAWHERLAERVCGSGEAWTSTVTIAGAASLRACITSYRTTDSDIGALCLALGRARRGRGRA